MIISLTVFSQTPTTFKYQAVLRDADGNVMSNQSLLLVVKITSDENSVEFIESHSTPTNEFGMVSLEIGSIETEDFASIDWSLGNYYLSAYYNGAEVGSSPILAVPYAIHAKTVDDQGVSYFTNDAGYVKSSELLDNDATNEIQTLDGILSDDNSAGNNQIKNLSTPTDDMDAATKEYVDQLISSKLAELGLFVEDADGNVYETVTIGGQTWMAENLKTTKYADGTDITYYTTDLDWQVPAYSWYSDDIDKVYGALYNGFIRSEAVCPTYWRIPTDDDFDILIEYAENINGGSSKSGEALKESGATHWNFDNGNNTTGFTAVGAGKRSGSENEDYEGIATDLDINTYLMSSSTTSGSETNYLNLRSNDDRAYTGSDYMDVGISIRCIKE